jgi:two-component system nitrogen regulation sensor histidine kinase NtrY
MELPEAPLTAYFDQRLISQVLTNLIKNATEAIEGAGIEAIKDPLITVNVHPEGDKARLSISDNGKGWPKENRQRLLEPYVTTREKGTGLGLAIVARIIEQHGGTVDLIDAEPDEAGRVGACFSFTLPLNSPNEPAEPSNERAEGEAASEPAAEGREEPPVLAVEKT